MIIAIAMNISDHYCLKEILLVVSRFYIFYMDIQGVPNSLFLILRSKGSSIVSVPLVINSIFLWLKTISIQYREKQSALYFFQKYSFCEDHTNLFWSQMFLSHKISADKLQWISNISVAKTCKFLWCVETELPLFTSFWNVDVLS